MLKRAQAAGYGIAAFNMIDYNSVRSIVEGAAALDAPMIVQVSVKTIKHWGFKPIATWVRMLAEDVPCRWRCISIIATISTSSRAALMRAGRR